jgi:hypothetical protein
VGTYNYQNPFFRYTGDWVQGKKHGHGVLFFGDGGSYEGAFVDGEIEGEGVRRWSDGSMYQGSFHCGEKTGQGYESFLSWVSVGCFSTIPPCAAENTWVQLVFRIVENG